MILNELHGLPAIDLFPQITRVAIDVGPDGRTRVEMFAGDLAMGPVDLDAGAEPERLRRALDVVHRALTQQRYLSPEMIEEARDSW